MIFSSVDGFTAVDSNRRILLDGCFDPLHFGHVRYIREAKLVFPDWPLVVAVASDDEIRSKGREPLMGQLSRCQTVDGLAGVDVVIAKDRPTHEIISALRPGAFVKGADWDKRLSPEILAACSLRSTQIVYLNTVTDSSSKALRQWALRDAERGLDRLETFMAGQSSATEPWRPVTDYSFEAREAIEGRHPDLILEAFQPKRVLDAGCGPGHLVRMLRERGVEAYGFDLNAPTGPNGQWFDCDDLCCDRPLDEWNTTPLDYDLVINREVLEHLTVQQIRLAVVNLFRLSSRYVYITTRFSDKGVFDAETDFETDPTHVTCLSQPFLRSLCVLNGGKRRKDLEAKLDHQNKGRVLVYEV